MGNIHIENLFTRKTSMRRRGETFVKYTAASGLDDWIGNISGAISGTSSSPYYTTQIPNVNQAKSISLGNGVTSIGWDAFRNCSGLTNLTIPNTVTSIGQNAFYNCDQLTSVTIPDSVTSIGSSAFGSCEFLPNMTLPDSISNISYGMFSDCHNIIQITFPKNVTNIEQYAFAYTNRITILDFRRSNSVPTLQNVNAFQNAGYTKEIIVPDSLYDDWIAASNWSSTTNNIVTCIVKASESSLGTL